MPASEPVRLALIGAGRMGSVHLRALGAAASVEPMGVVEPFAPNRELAAATGVDTFVSVDELLAAAHPEAVLIAAPSDQHAELVERFARERIPLLCEKPVGVRPEDAEAAARNVAATGVLLQVGYWRRFVPELLALRERIAAGELGAISALSCMQWDHELPSEQFRSHSGGITVDMGVHEFDQARWLLGEELDLLAATAAGPDSAPRPASDPDCAAILGRSAGGAAVTIFLGRRFPHADSCWLEIWGTEGYERIPFMWDESGERVFERSMVTQVEAFARAVRGAPCEGAQAQDAIAALTLAHRAAAALSCGGGTG